VIRFYRVRGLVQGVGFRVATQREALRLGLRGWVRNRQDGSVEVFVSGGEETIGRLEVWLARGPRGARVSSLEVASEDATPPEAEAGEGFVVRPTV
jgi:acylphosphatase